MPIQPVWVKVKNQGTRRDFRGRAALGQIVRAPEKPSAGPWEPNYQQWGKNIPEKKLLLHLTWVDRPPELVAVAVAGCADKTARRRLRLRFPADFRFLSADVNLQPRLFYLSANQAGCSRMIGPVHFPEIDRPVKVASEDGGPVDPD
jgi:hypothetical protein